MAGGEGVVAPSQGHVDQRLLYKKPGIPNSNRFIV